MANKRALIVDDSTTAQYRLKKMLRRYPLDIDVADSGEAALRHLAHHVPDVIFMDHTMPGMDGFRALQIIKSHPETAMVPVIMYTAQSGDLYTGQARALGALDVVSKDTINATDLSKVMNAIRIYPADQQETPATPVESADLISAANQVSDGDESLDQSVLTDSAARKASRAEAVRENTVVEDVAREALVRDALGREEPTRNLELRLSHMEHVLEDNRRFITSRVVRELQSLRKGLRDDLAHVVVQQQQHQPAPVLPPPETPELHDKPSGPNIGKIALIIILLVIAFLLVHISKQLNQNAHTQEQLGKELAAVSVRVNQEADLVPPALQNVALQQVTTGPNSMDFIEDIAWTFNQNATLAFKQNTIDPTTVLRLHELLHRLASNGFRGLAQVTIYVGNFCVAIDNMGTAQLAEPTSTLSDCMLSSEIYMLERVMDEYVRETNMMLSNLTRSVNSTIQIQINAAEGADAYPERIPTVSARDWNRVAQNNNRIELTLIPEDPRP